jgi:hypothetical protein
MIFFFKNASKKLIKNLFKKVKVLLALKTSFLETLALLNVFEKNEILIFFFKTYSWFFVKIVVGASTKQW